MSDRYHAFGTVLQMSDGAASPAFTAIAGLTNIDGPGVSVESLDATAHDSASAARQKLPGLVDGGQVTIEGYYDPADPTHDGTTGIAGVATDRAVRDFRIIDVDDANSQTDFSGFFVEFRRTAPFDGLLGFTATIEVTGVPTFPA